MERSPVCRLLVVLGLLLAGCASSGLPEGDGADDGSAADERWRAGAVSRLDPDEIAQAPALVLEDLLVGRVAGLRVETRPDGRREVIIRGRNTIYGSNEPLYVVDGVPLFHSAGGLAGLNPADIESIEVIKDGSAAMYGVRGANGVILIRTKRGGQ